MSKSLKLMKRDFRLDKKFNAIMEGTWAQQRETSNTRLESKFKRAKCEKITGKN